MTSGEIAELVPRGMVGMSRAVFLEADTNVPEQMRGVG